MNIFDLQATISLNGDAFMSGVENAQTAFNGLGSSISPGAVAIGTAVGNMATSAAKNLIDLGKQSIQTGINFDDSMAKVKAISGATDEQFQQLRDAAREWGSTTKFHASDVADAFTYMAMAGWGAEDMLNAIGGVLNLAAASGEDLATVSDIVTDGMTAIGMSSSEADRFVNAFAAAAANSNTNVGMLGETFKYVAPLAGTLNYDLEELLTATGLMANNGIKASQAGTGLRAALSSLVDPTDKVNEALRDLGLLKLADDTGEFAYDMEALNKEVVAVEKATDAYNKTVEKYGEDSEQAANKAVKMAEAQRKLNIAMEEQKNAALTYNSAMVDEKGEMRSLDETIGILREAFSGLDADQQAQYASTIFGREAMTGMLAIFGSSDKDINKLTQALDSASDGMGAAAEMADTMEDNVGGDLRKLSSAFEDFQIGIKDKLETPFRDAVQTATGALEAMTRGFGEDGIKGALSELGTFMKESLSGLWDNLELPPSVQGIADKIGEIFNALKPITDEGIAMVQEVMSGISEAFGGLGDTFSNIDLSIFSNIAGKVGELIGAFARAGEVKADALVSAVQGIAGAFENVDIGSAVSTVAQGISDFVSAFAGASADVISGVADAVSGFLGSFEETGAIDAIGQVGQNAAELVSAFLTASGDVIKDVAGGVGEFLNAFEGSSVGESIGTIAKSAGDLLSAFLTAGETVINGVASGIGNFLDAFDESAAVDALASVSELVADLFEPFTASLGEWIQKAADGLSGVAEHIGTLSGNLANGIVDGIKDLADNFEKWAPLVAAVAAGLVTMTIVTTVAAGFATFTAALKSGELAAKAMAVAQGVLNAVMNANPVALVVSAIAALAAGLAVAWATNEDFRNSCIEAWEAIKEAAGAVAEAVSKFFTEQVPKAFDTMINWFKGLGEKFKQIGNDLVAGIKSGFLAAWDSFVSSIKELANGVVDKVKSIFGIHSPSTVFAEIGENLVFGMQEGWSSAFGGLERQVERDSKRLIETASVAFPDSAIGKSSAAGISAINVSQSSGWVPATEINLNVDGEKVAKVVYDPLNGIAEQKDDEAMRRIRLLGAASA